MGRNIIRDEIKCLIIKEKLLNQKYGALKGNPTVREFIKTGLELYVVKEKLSLQKKALALLNRKLCKHPLWFVFSEKNNELTCRCIKCDLVRTENKEYFSDYIYGPDLVEDYSKILDLFISTQIQFNKDNNTQKTRRSY